MSDDPLRAALRNVENWLEKSLGIPADEVEGWPLVKERALAASATLDEHYPHEPEEGPPGIVCKVCGEDWPCAAYERALTASATDERHLSFDPVVRIGAALERRAALAASADGWSTETWLPIDGKPHHVAVVRDGDDVRWYVDGEEPLVMDELATYEKPLSEDQIKARFAASATEEPRCDCAPDWLMQDGSHHPDCPLAASATEEPPQQTDCEAEVDRLNRVIAALTAGARAVKSSRPAAALAASATDEPTQDTAQLDWRDSR